MTNAATIVVLELDVVVVVVLPLPRLLLRIRRLSPALAAGWGAPLPLLRPFAPVLAGMVRSKRRAEMQRGEMSMSKASSFHEAGAITNANKSSLACWSRRGLGRSI